MLLLGARTLHLREARRRHGHLRLELTYVELGDHPPRVALSREVQRGPPGGERALVRTWARPPAGRAAGRRLPGFGVQDQRPQVHRGDAVDQRVVAFRDQRPTTT